MTVSKDPSSFTGKNLENEERGVWNGCTKSILKDSLNDYMIIYYFSDYDNR